MVSTQEAPMQLHSNPDPLQELVSAQPVLVVGEDPLVRESVVRRVRGRASESVSSSAAEAAARTSAEVVLWDLGPSTAGNHGYRFDSVQAPVIALAPADAKALPLLSAGAAAVLRRDVSGDALRSAIDSVKQGLKVIDPELLDTPLGVGDSLQLVALDKGDVFPSELGQVVKHAAADNTAADDNNLRMGLHENRSGNARVRQRACSSCLVKNQKSVGAPPSALRFSTKAVISSSMAGSSGGCS